MPPWHIRPTVINRHRDRLASFEIGDFGFRTQRQRPMRGSQGVLIERLAARRRLAVETRPIPGGRDDLRWRGFAGGSGLLVGLGSRRGLLMGLSCEAHQPCDTDEAPPHTLLVKERQD